jgi:hypothetical protein
MTQTITNHSAEELVRKLRDEVERVEAVSRRNGWDTAHQGSVYPGGVLVDSLLDLRSVLREGPDAAAVAVVDEALREYGRRPGACTTTEVRELCERLSNLLIKEECV